MPFYLKHSDKYGNIAVSKVHQDSGPTRANHVQNHGREYCFVLEGTLQENKTVHITAPFTHIIYRALFSK